MPEEDMKDNNLCFEYTKYTATARHLSDSISDRYRAPFLFLTPQMFSTAPQRTCMHLWQLTFSISEEEIQNYFASILTKVHYDLHDILSGLTQY